MLVARRTVKLDGYALHRHNELAVVKQRAALCLPAPLVSERSPSHIAFGAFDRAEQAVRKAHLQQQDGRCVCGWRPTPTQIVRYESPEDWHREYEEHKSCDHCWRLFTVPDSNIYGPGKDDPEEALPDIEDDNMVSSTSEDSSSGTFDPESASAIKWTPAVDTP